MKSEIDYCIISLETHASNFIQLFESFFLFFLAASESKAVDWSGTEQGMISTSSRRLPSQSPNVVIEDTTPTRSITSSTPSRGSSGRRNAASLQINHKVQAKRPLMFS